MKTEINLLSPIAKHDRMYLIGIRRINSIVDAVAVSLFLVACSYGVAFWVLFATYSSLAKDLVIDGQNSSEVKQRIRDINAIIAVVDDRVTQESLWTPLVSDIVSAAPSAISISKLELNEQSRTFSLTGRATHGSAVVQYQRTLEKLPWVDRVVAPLQNFALTPDATVVFTIFRKSKEISPAL